MKKTATLALLCLAHFGGSPAPASQHENADLTGITVIAYSADSQNLYFWLDGFEVPPTQTDCPNPTKFGIPVDQPEYEPLADQVKMAFLSGKRVRVTWETDGGCTGRSPTPFYVKIYR